jgi:hypothetical protein
LREWITVQTDNFVRRTSVGERIGAQGDDKAGREKRATSSEEQDGEAEREKARVRSESHIEMRVVIQRPSEAAKGSYKSDAEAAPRKAAALRVSRPERAPSTHD